LPCGKGSSTGAPRDAGQDHDGRDRACLCPSRGARLRGHVVSVDIGAFRTGRCHRQRLRFDIAVAVAGAVAGAGDDAGRSAL
jgi:hypothetical protein